MTDFDLDEFLPYQLAVLAGRVSRGFAEQYRSKFGLTIPEWRVLVHLSQAETLSIRDLHERADLEKSKASRAASRLEASGLIAKRDASDDRRLVALTLTPKGKDLMARLIPLAQAYEKRFFEQMAPADRSAFTRIMGDLLVQTQRPMGE
jgi:DNA-binding MarR family transcriptional regulator